LPTGVTRITLPARLIPFTGGYRAVMPAPVRALLAALRPDALGFPTGLR
jgi:alpha-1,6-mannosyltransferase